MNNTLSKVLIFAAGAAVGSVAAWKICKDRYEAIIEEEINSVKEKFSVAKADEIEAEDEDEEESGELPRRMYEKPDLQEYAKRLEYYRGQIAEDDMTAEEQSEEEAEETDEEETYIPDEVEETKAGIYVIEPGSFGDDDYDTEYYTLYADGVVADGRNYVVDHPEAYLGHYYKTHFGTYEEDLVCVRNDQQKTDYEITRVDDRYEDLFTVGRVTDEEDTE